MSVDILTLGFSLKVETHNPPPHERLLALRSLSVHVNYFSVCVPTEKALVTDVVLLTPGCNKSHR
jgi:hypothetical protein